MITLHTKNMYLERRDISAGIIPVKIEYDKSRCVKLESSLNLAEMSDPVKSLSNNQAF